MDGFFFPSKSDIDTFYQFTVALIVFEKKFLANPRLILLKDVFSEGAQDTNTLDTDVQFIRFMSAHFNNCAQDHLFKWTRARITSAQASP